MLRIYHFWGPLGRIKFFQGGTTPDFNKKSPTPPSNFLLEQPSSILCKNYKETFSLQNYHNLGKKYNKKNNKKVSAIFVKKLSNFGHLLGCSENKDH